MVTLEGSSFCVGIALQSLPCPASLCHYQVLFARKIRSGGRIRILTYPGPAPMRLGCPGIPLSETQANDSPAHATHEHARLPVRIAAMLQPGTRWQIRASLGRAEMLRESGHLLRRPTE